MKTFFINFIFLITLFLPTLLNATELANDTFDGSNASGYSRDDGNNNVLKINRDQHSSKTYNFGNDYANSSLTITFDFKVQGSWDNSGRNRDYFIVKFNDNEVHKQSYAASNSWKHLTLQGKADGNGNFKIDFFPDTTANNEYIIIDNIIINGEKAPTTPDLPPLVCSNTTGLTANYYNNKTFTAPAALTRTDATINFDWGSGSPDSSINNDNFSVIWSGTIAIDEDASYTFSFLHDDDLTVSIDGTTIYNYNTWSSGNFRSDGSETLTRGCHTIELKLIEKSGGASTKMKWKNDASLTSDVIVPSSNLFSPDIVNADISITEYQDPSLIEVDINNDVSFFTRVIKDSSTDSQADIIVEFTYNMDVVFTEIDQVNGGSEFENCDKASGDTISSGSKITCTKTSTLATAAPNKDIKVTVKPQTSGTLIQTAKLIPTTNDSDLTNNEINSTSVTVNSDVIENANDVCYADPITTGIDMGIGSFMSRTELPLRNVSNDGKPLENVIIEINEDGMGGSFANTCGVDSDNTDEDDTDGGSCDDDSNGVINIGSNSSTYTITDNINSGDESTSIWSKSTIEMGLFEENIYATYIKDGTTYRGVIASCGITIGFDKNEYQTKEDYTLFDNFTSELEINIVLSSAASSDTTVTYTTRDGTATAGTTNDYLSTTGTATIPEGETNTTIYIDIVHDIDIELDEYFYVDLSSINPADGSIGMGINPVKITILAQTANDLPLCYSDDFSNDLDDQWRTLRGVNYTPKVVDGRLRLTDGSGSIATAVTKDYEFASQYNMIVVEFKQYAYGGCMDTSEGVGSGLGDYGADGIVAVLYDSDIGAEPKPGATGGSMGYAQNTGGNGFEGGWLGLGIDEYGNYATATEGRDGGLSTKYLENLNRVSIRGDGEGKVGYEFLAGSETLTEIADKNSATPKYGYKYKMTTDARDPNHLYITLERDTGDGYQIIIDQFDAKDVQYNQSTTPDFVRFAFTSGTGGGCNRHEIDELSVRGYCQPYDPNPPSTIENKSDIVNNYTTDGSYNTGTKYITTKVAGKTESLTGVHLDDTSRAVPFTSRDGLTFKMIPYLSNSDCSTRKVLTDVNGNPAVITVTNGNTVGLANVVMPKEAIKDARISLSALDLQQVYTNSNQQCLKNSDTNGNLQGISACLNTSDYLLTFGQETYDRCYVGNGEPCKAGNNGVGTAPYNNSYGCLMCTFDTSSTCSSDNFAIRPDGLHLSSTNNDFPDLLRASEDYALTLKAFNSNNPTNVDDLTTNYTIIDAQDIVIFDTTLNAADGTPDTNLAGTTSWSAVTNFDIINGISTDGVTNEVASIKFDNVGKVNIKVIDKLWANVDLTDERGMRDPSSTLYKNCNANGAYVCGSIDTTFIPHHFTLVNSSITNNDANSGNFTYFSTLTPGAVATYTMAARVTTQIESRNKDERVTTNFKTGSYENPLNVQLIVTDGDHGVASPTEIGDGTASGNKLLNFTDGTYTVPWNETDNTKMLRFNFTRTNNTPVNPFQVMPDEVIITVDSIYTAVGTPSSPVTITQDLSGNGATVGNITNSATFIYGRTHATRQRFTGATGTAFIKYEAYCNGTDASGNVCNKVLLPNGTNSQTSDDPRWFINTHHAYTTDGVIQNVFQKGGSGTVTLNTAVGSTTSGKTAVPLKYNSTNYPYKTTMENNASSWLIYNKYNVNAQTNKFDVEFTNNANTWAGQHETNTTTKRNASDKTNRRSMW